MIKNKHPYLMLEQNKILDIKDKITFGEIKYQYDNLINKCESILGEKAISYSKSINDNIISEYYRERIPVLCLGYLLSGNIYYAEDAKREAFELLEQIIDMRLVLYNEFNPAMGNMAATLAIAYDWLYDYLNSEEKKKLREGIILRILEPFYENKHRGNTQDDFKNLIEHPMLNFGIGVAVLSVFNDWNASRICLKLCLESIQKNFLSSLDIDGFFKGDINVWRIIVAEFLMFALCHDFNLETEDKVFDNNIILPFLNYPIDIAPHGVSVGFMDYGTSFLNRYDYTNWVFNAISKLTNNQIYKWYGERYFSYNPISILFQTPPITNNPIKDKWKNYGKNEVCVYTNQLDKIKSFSFGSTMRINGFIRGKAHLTSLSIEALKQVIQCNLYNSEGLDNFDRQSLTKNISSFNRETTSVLKEEEINDNVVFFEQDSYSYYIHRIKPVVKSINSIDRVVIDIEDRFIIVTDILDFNEPDEILWEFKGHGYEDLNNKDFKLNMKQTEYKIFTISNINMPKGKVKKNNANSISGLTCSEDIVFYTAKNLFGKVVVAACIDILYPGEKAAQVEGVFDENELTFKISDNEYSHKIKIDTLKLQVEIM